MTDDEQSDEIEEKTDSKVLFGCYKMTDDTGKTILIADGHTYHRSRGYNNSEYWHCREVSGSVK